MSFNAICVIKILFKISEFTVTLSLSVAHKFQQHFIKKKVVRAKKPINSFHIDNFSYPFCCLQIFFFKLNYSKISPEIFCESGV